MSKRIQEGGLQVAAVLHELVANEITPGIDVSPERFWQGLEQCLEELGPCNKALLEARDRLQEKIDAWHRQRSGQPHDPAA